MCEPRGGIEPACCPNPANHYAACVSIKNIQQPVVFDTVLVTSHVRDNISFKIITFYRIYVIFQFFLPFSLDITSFGFLFAI